MGRRRSYTDLDTLIMGRGENHFQLAGDGAFGAPYILDTVGGSPNTNLGGGIWAFDTASGGAEDIVAAPAQEGLHAVALHQVGWNASKFNVPFRRPSGARPSTRQPCRSAARRTPAAST